MAKRIAYLRVSTAEQRVDRQVLGLEGLADELHIETLSAVAPKRQPARPAMPRSERIALDQLQPRHALERFEHERLRDVAGCDLGVAFRTLRQHQRERIGLAPERLVYEHHLAEADLTDQEKREFIEALWYIIVSFVDLGFGIEPVNHALRAAALDDLQPVQSVAETAKESLPVVRDNATEHARDHNNKENRQKGREA